MLLDYHYTLILSIEVEVIILSFSSRLSQLMDERAITNYRLAKAVGVHATTVKNWRAGTVPRLEHIKAVADYFNMPLNGLIT